MRDLKNTSIDRFVRGCRDFEQAIGSLEMGQISDYEAAVSSAAQRVGNALELAMKFHLKSVCDGRILSSNGEEIDKPSFFQLVQGMEHYGEPPLDPEIGSRLFDYRDLRNQAEHKATVPPFEALHSALLETRHIILTYLDIDDQLREVPGLPTPVSVAPGEPSQVFIGYKRHSQPDEGLARYLKEQLTGQGHQVFIDQTMRTGDAWLERIDDEIRTSDFVVALLSEESADSEMLRSEIKRAFDYRRMQGKPQTLPVRIAYRDLLPYSIATFLDPLQYVLWNSESDNERVVQEILDAMGGRLAGKAPVQIDITDGDSVIFEDGCLVTSDERVHAPRPEFDPRFLAMLEAPGDAVKLRSELYIEREADARLKNEIVKSGTTVSIRAPRQTGKTSLLVRGVHYAQEHGARGIHIDVQRLDREWLQTYDKFLYWLAEVIVRKLRLDTAEVEKAWGGSLGPQDKLTYLIEDYILPESDTTIILAMDEVDRLLQTPFHSSFFGLVRSWHETRPRDDRWNKLNIVLVISTEPYWLTNDSSQSPFNVGRPIRLEDFDEEQVRDLNQRHGSPVKEPDFSGLMQLLNGHPYLTRRALYELVAEGRSWAELARTAPEDDGPFGSHLRDYHRYLLEKPDLKEALKQIIHQHRCEDEMVFFRLLRAGLAKGNSDRCTCRCGLYRMYFQEKL
jgi:hypothetical protein